MINRPPLKPSLQTAPRIALVLGGGGARGLAHIHALQAFDELGLRPSYIAGTSIGAIFGASYASGLRADEILDHSMQTLGKRLNILKNLFVRKFASLKDLWNIGAPRRSLMNPVALLDIVFPDNVSRRFEDLSVPLEVIATNYYEQHATILNQGEIIDAVAASIALPAIFRPVTISNQVLIDGGFSNPLPFDIVGSRADLTVAIDVAGGPEKKDTAELPSGSEVLFAASQILQNNIIREKLKSGAPEILIRPPVDHVPVLAFHRIEEILQHTKPVKDEIKQKLMQSLERSAHASL